jgi:MFS family permease
VLQFPGKSRGEAAVVWLRLLKLTLGNTVYATSIVISVFMGGLALGAMLMGRFSDRVTGRLRLYALLELPITLTAAGLNLLVAFGGWSLWRSHASEADVPPEGSPEPPPQSEPGGTAGGFPALALALFLSGMISIGYEIVWIRSPNRGFSAGTW